MMWMLACVLAAAPVTTQVDVWVSEQAETLKENTADNPAERAQALFSHVFVSHYVTADDTTLESDWGQITADATAVDTWELTDRLLRVSRKLGWAVQPDDTAEGPVLIFGQGENSYVMIVRHGQYGLWNNWSSHPVPGGLSGKRWQQVLDARRAWLRHEAGDSRGLKKLNIENEPTPMQALCLLARQGDIPLKTLEDWATRWPGISAFVVEALRQAREQGQHKVAERLWQQRRESSSADVYLEGALWAYSLQQEKVALERLEKALKLDPHHSRALRLLKAWRRQ